MNYSKIYDKLIEKRKTSVLKKDSKNFPGYCENHHIIPVSLGGTNEIDNIVCLTPREHYIAHLLLTKIYPENIKLKKAVLMMTANSKKGKQKRHFNFNSKIYEKIRKEVALDDSINFSGRKNPMYNSSFRWITQLPTFKHKRYDKHAQLTEFLINDGWIDGYILSPESEKMQIENAKKRKKRIGFISIKNERLKQTRQLNSIDLFTDELKSDGWERGIYLTEAIKAKLFDRKRIEKAIETRRRNNKKSLYKNGRRIKNEKIGKTAFLKYRDILTDKMISEGWEYGSFQTEKCKKSHIEREKKYNVFGEMLTLKEISNKYGVSESAFVQRYKRGYDIGKCLSDKKFNIRNITYNGKNKNLTEWADELGISVAAFSARVKKYNNDNDKIFRTDKKFKGYGKIEYMGERHTLKEWCEKIGLPYSTGRLKMREFKDFSKFVEYCEKRNYIFKKNENN